MHKNSSGAVFGDEEDDEDDDEEDNDEEEDEDDNEEDEELPKMPTSLILKLTLTQSLLP